MEKEELKACPFCGGEVWIEDEIRSFNWVSCNDCETDGPIKKDIKTAIEAWNNQVLLSTLAEKDRQLNQVSINFKFLMDIIDTIHFDLFPDKSGTWQTRAQQSAAEVRRIKGH